MCKGILGSCICGHYQVIRWTTRCKSLCKYPCGHTQRVDFQCHGCDAWNQQILELHIAAERRAQVSMKGTIAVWKYRRRIRGPKTDAQMEVIRQDLLAKQAEREKMLAEQLRGEMDRVTQEWMVRLEGELVLPEHRHGTAPLGLVMGLYPSIYYQ